MGERGRVEVGLCKILPWPILYCVWHTKGESGGRRVLRKVVQYYYISVGSAGMEGGQ